MHRLPPLGRVFVAIALLAFGIQHLVYADFVTRLVPKLPAWAPAPAFLAYAFGALLLAAGVVFTLALKPARSLALVLGGIALLSFAGLYLPRLLSDLRNGGLWTQSFKALAFTGTFLALAATFSSPTSKTAPLVVAARACFAAFLILAGVQHFIYAAFVDTLVPAWIPLPARFWTCFSAVALMAGGVGLLLPKTQRLAALLTGLMIFTWLWTLHLVRAIHTPADANEVTAFFEALAFSGVGFILSSLGSAPDTRSSNAPILSPKPVG